MGLKVFVGSQASRAYENEYFRELANSIAVAFRHHGLSGYLLGHPECVVDEYFKPDALLITDSSVQILEFKNFHDVVVELPDESNFTTGRWRALRSGQRPVNVAGGSSENPFSQLQKQRVRLSQITDRLGLEPQILLRVLFQGDVSIKGRIPGRYQSYFNISSHKQAVNVILDGARLHGTGYKFSPELLLSKFRMVPYQELETFTASVIDKAKKVADADGLLVAAESKNRAAQEALDSAEQSKKALAEVEQLKRDEIQSLQQAKADAQAVTKDFNQKQYDLEKRKSIRGTTVAFAVIAVALLALFGIFGVAQSNAKQAQRTSYLEGRTCIPAAESNEYIGAKAVCVSFKVGHIGESGKLVFIQEQIKNGFTALAINGFISKAQAEKLYLGKQIEVRGDIVDYKGSPEIEVFSNSQIKVIG